MAGDLVTKVQKVLNSNNYGIWGRNGVENLKLGVRVFDVVQNRQTTEFGEMLIIRVPKVLKCTKFGTTWNYMRQR